MLARSHAQKSVDNSSAAYQIATGIQTYLSSQGYTASSSFQPAVITLIPGTTQSETQISPSSSSSQFRPTNGVPILPATIWDELLRLNVPVGSSDDDEDILLKALHESASNSQTYREALEALHGVNHHFASAWKDYYIDHRKKIHKRLKKMRRSKKQQNSRSEDTVDNPVVDLAVATSLKPNSSFKHVSTSFDRSPSPDALRSLPTPQTGGTLGRITHLQDEPVSPTAPHGRPTGGSTRSTNGLASSRKRPSTLRIGTPPSRSPSPPTTIVDVGGKNRYTREDDEFFVKLIQWESRRNGRITRTRLSQILAAKAPHHPESSWRQHMAHNAEFVNRLLADARRNDLEIAGNMGTEVQEIEEPSAEVEDPNTDDDESTLRKHSSDTFADAEFRLMARYIARGPSWFDNTDSLERLRPFQVKHLIERYKAQYSYEEEDLVLSYPAEVRDPSPSEVSVQSVQLLGPPISSISKRKSCFVAAQANSELLVPDAKRQKTRVGCNILGR